MRDNFSNTINSFVNESIIDYPRGSLDPNVFQFNEDSGIPLMLPIIRSQIMYDVAIIDKLVRINRFFVIGSILTQTYTPRSDIDVTVEVESKVEEDDILSEKLNMLLKTINGRLAAGTQHPIHYYIVGGEYDLDKAEAAYDVMDQKWIKEPEAVDIDVKDYMEKFQGTVNGVDIATGELRRDIIDYEQLKTFSPKQIKQIKGILDEKALEIEKDVDALVKSYEQLRSSRKQAFRNPMSPSDIKKYGEKFKLPENVIYKLLEKYYYIEFIKKINELSEDKDGLTSKDISKIKQAGRMFWK